MRAPTIGRFKRAGPSHNDCAAPRGHLKPASLAGWRSIFLQGRIGVRMQSSILHSPATLALLGRLSADQKREKDRADALQSRSGPADGLVWLDDAITKLVELSGVDPQHSPGWQESVRRKVRNNELALRHGHGLYELPASDVGHPHAAVAISDLVALFPRVGHDPTFQPSAAPGPAIPAPPANAAGDVQPQKAETSRKHCTAHAGRPRHLLAHLVDKALASGAQRTTTAVFGVLVGYADEAKTARKQCQPNPHHPLRESGHDVVNGKEVAALWFDDGTGTYKAWTRKQLDGHMRHYGLHAISDSDR